MGDYSAGHPDSFSLFFVRRQFCLFAADGSLLANVRIMRPDEACAGAAADYFRLIADGCEAYAREGLAAFASGCYAADTDTRKRFNFRRFIYRCDMQITCRGTELLSVLAQTRLERGGEVLAAGQTARIFTPSGMLPPTRLVSRRALRSGGEILLDRSGEPYLRTPGKTPGEYTQTAVGAEKKTRGKPSNQDIQENITE